MTGIFGILESSATQCYQDVAPTQEFFFPWSHLKSMPNAEGRSSEKKKLKKQEKKAWTHLCNIISSTNHQIKLKEFTTKLNLV
jgi:hypothetical protein